MQNKDRFDGKVALISGSSRGIGKAIALRLATKGAKIAVNYKENKPAAEEVVNEVKILGSDAMAFQADISQPEQVEEMGNGINKAWGGIHILVNNAGMIKDNLLLRMSVEEWSEVLDVNLKGTFLCSRLAIKYMLRQKWGRIINITSIGGIRGRPGQANYGSAKAGVIGFTHSLAREVGSRNITVNASAPGWITTDIVKDVSEDIRNMILSQTPVDRLGTPEDVAGVVDFLASDDASFVTGQVIAVDGGVSV